MMMREIAAEPSIFHGNIPKLQHFLAIKPVSPFYLPQLSAQSLAWFSPVLDDVISSVDESSLRRLPQLQWSSIGHETLDDALV